MRHIKGYQQIINESEDKSPKMLVGDMEMGRVIPVDISEYSEAVGEHDWHQVFLLDDPGFRNKIILIAGMLTFRKVSEGSKELLKTIWHNQPESMGSSTSEWRLMDIDEMEDFYRFYASGGMGEYDGLLEKDGALDYGTSDLEDVDKPNRSRIYAINLRTGRRRSNYQHEEKLIIGIRDVTDDEILGMAKYIYEKVPLTQSTLIIGRIERVYPHINIDPLFSNGRKEDIFKGSNVLRKFGFN